MVPSDSKDLWEPVETLAGCLEHARSLGIRYPCQLMQAYRGGQPSWYDRDEVPNSVYPANAIDDAWEKWLP
jgi:hypothetical protein